MAAIEIAVAGCHNLLLIGPPGAGKTMLAERIPTILPEISAPEALDTTLIYSVTGHLQLSRLLLNRRPFRFPHHLAQEAKGRSGMLVLTPKAIQDPAGLEELVKRLPPELLQRIIWFNTGVALAKRLHALEPTLQIIEDYNTQALVLKLLSQEAAEKISTTSESLTLYLQEVLPMTVTYLKALTVKLILVALGVPMEQLNQIDPTQLETLFAPITAA